MDERCQVCGLQGESINHILFECTVARQVWASSGIPTPELGFHQTSIFENVSYLLGLKQKRCLPTHITRVWPWIVWMLWKARNEFLFQGRDIVPAEIVIKAYREAEEWVEAQVIENEMINAESANLKPEKAKWKPPEKGWKMCNVGFDWNNEKSLAGGGWVVRNERGVVQCHSRRAFSNIRSVDEAKLAVILWTLESMKSHRMTKIIVVGEFGDFFGAVERPQAWPSFCFQAGEIEIGRSLIVDCRFLVVRKEANRGATFIAQSVTKQGLVRSYVQCGHSSWLFEFFVNESRGL